MLLLMFVTGENFNVFFTSQKNDPYSSQFSKRLFPRVVFFTHTNGHSQMDAPSLTGHTLPAKRSPVES